MISFRDTTSALAVRMRNTPPPSLGSREVRTIPKPQPKRRLKESSLSEHIKNRDLRWLQAQQQSAATPDSRIASPVVDTGAQPSTFVSLNDIAGAPAAEKLWPYPMPGRIYPRPLPSGLMTANEPAAAENLRRSSTFAQALNEEETTSIVADIVMTRSDPENIAPDVTTSSPKQNTDSPAPAEPPATPSDHVRIENHGGEFLLAPVATPQDNPPRFGGKMIVMILQRGLESARGNLEITFNLGHTCYLCIARWAKRKSSPICGTKCLSVVRLLSHPQSPIQYTKRRSGTGRISLFR
ncbi:hypothetical protein EDB19DRAFT_565181 [Suillus lakei]|nr:hypothetical protein EDB19DRAFT_565181 [Suillus lakei]